MKMYDATLKIVRDIAEHYVGVTAGTGTLKSINDPTMRQQAGLFNGGTIWILNQFRVVSTYGSGSIAWETDLALPPPAGTGFTIATKNFPLSILKQAVNAILDDYPVEKKDTTLVVDVTNNGEYTLPTGVNNVLMTEIALNDAAPYNFVPLYTDHEDAGTLFIDGGIFTQDNGKKIRLTYQSPHGVITDAADINPNVDMVYLKYAAITWLWNEYILRTKLDNPIAKDSYAAARFNEAERMSKAMAPQYISRQSIKFNHIPGF
jgi:hypothetical protein